MTQSTQSTPMTRLKSFLKQEALYLLIITIMLLAFFAPFYAKDLPTGAENGFHYGRLLSLVRTLQQGIFPAKLRPMSMRGFGYGVGFFYSDFFLYPSAALVLLGMDIIPALKVYVVIAGIIGAIATYRSLYKLIGDRRIAVVADILYFGTYFLWLNLYDGFGIGAFVAQVFTPLALCGLTRALRDERGGYIEYAIGIVVIVLSHHLSFISLMIGLFMMVLINIKTIIKTPRILGKLFGVSMIGLFFTAQYWMPAMELAIHTKYKVIYDNYIDINDHILNISDVIRCIAPVYFIAFILAAALFIYTMIRTRKVYMEGLTYLIVTALHIIIMRSQLFWRGPIGQFFAFYQSTERLTIIVMPLMVVFYAIVFKTFKDEILKKADTPLIKNQYIFAILAVVLIIAGRLYVKPDFYNPAAYSRNTGLDHTYLETASDYAISCGEWLPVECEPSACREVNNSRCDDGTSADGFKHDDNKYYEAWVLLDKKYYDVPYVYYYGYRAYLIDDNANPVKELSVGEAYDDNGYVRVFMPEDGEGVGHLMVTYRKTTVQKLSYIISIATTLFVIALLFYARKKEKAANS